MARRAFQDVVADRVPDVEVAPGLAALAVDGQRVADGGLHHEAVQRGAEDAVVVEAVHEQGVGGRLLGRDAVHDTLHRGGSPASVMSPGQASRGPQGAFGEAGEQVRSEGP